MPSKLNINPLWKISIRENDFAIAIQKWNWCETLAVQAIMEPVFDLAFWSYFIKHCRHKMKVCQIHKKTDTYILVVPLKFSLVIHQ